MRKHSPIGSLSSFVLGATIFTATTLLAYAENGLQSQVWYSAEGTPQVTVFVQESSILAQTFSNLPAVTLQQVNSDLLETYGEHYVKIADFNRDGLMDVGVLQGAGLAGSNLCYQVYEYLPVIFSYGDKSTFDVCRNVETDM